MRTVTVILLLALATQLEAANVYIRDGGSGDGSAWNNALDDLPATLVRGNTYYVADGSYNSYTFDDAQSGTLVITVKKATEADHGTETGWNSAYGDGQAVFAAALDILRPYYVIDGQTRDESNWFDGTKYGFKIAHDNNNTQIYCGDKRATNITLKYIHVESRNTDVATPKTSLYIADFDGAPRFANYVVQRCFFDKGNVHIFSRENDGMLIEYSAFADNTNDDAAHGEAISAYFGNHSFVFRYSKFKNITGTAVFAFAGDSWQIYGNVIDSPTVGGDGVVAGFSSGYSVNNTRFHHNTIYNSVSSGNGGVYYSSGTNNLAYNNLWIGNGTIFINGTHNYNGFSGANAYGEANAQTGLSSSIFANTSGGDFRLTTATAAGTALGSPYAADLAGATRGADGTLDRGAYEYSAAVPGTRVFNLFVNP